MDLEEVRRRISERSDELEEFAVESLAAFGSVAEGTANEASDIDVLVRFRDPATFDRYIGLRIWLEDLLGIHVDLVTEGGLRPELASLAEEAVRVA